MVSLCISALRFGIELAFELCHLALIPGFGFRYRPGFVVAGLVPAFSSQWGRSQRREALQTKGLAVKSPSPPALGFIR
jgi:hypothetical protein